MKIKHAALALAAFAAMAASTSSSAASLTANVGATFNVTSACTLTGAAATLTTMSAGQTVGNYGTLHGVGASTGTDANFGLTPMATVNCTNGTPWTLFVNGSGALSAGVFTGPSGATPFEVLPVARFVDGVATTENLRNTFAGVSRTGTGVAQVVTGNWALSNEPGAVATTTPLLPGTYTLAATATLNF